MYLAMRFGDPHISADGFDCAGRLLVGHVLAETGRPPGGDVDGAEQEHVRAQENLSPTRFPALHRIQQAGVQHDANRLFESALEGLTLSLKARHPIPSTGANEC